MRHRPDCRPPWRRKRRRPWAPGEGPNRTAESSLFPGGNVRILTSAPDWAFNDPNKLPTFPGPAPADPAKIDTLSERNESDGFLRPTPVPPQSPEVLPTGQPGTPEVDPPASQGIRETLRQQTSDERENEMLHDNSSPASHDEPLQDEQHPEPIYLEDFDPETQRVVYSALAGAPERGIGPNAFFAAHPVAPPDEAPTYEDNETTQTDELRAPKSSKRRSSGRPINIGRRHESHCTICNHPEREAIEQAFLHWWRPTDLAYHFKLGNRLVVYRHAHAMNLFERRTARTHHALGYMIEQAESVTPTADSIIRAIRALSCIDQDGRWHEPRKEVLIIHQHLETPAPLLDTPVEKKTGLIAPDSTT